MDNTEINIKEDEKIYEVKLEDFNLFKKEAEYWIKYFGLKQYRFTFVFGEEENIGASCYWCEESGNVTINLSTKLGWEFDDYTIKLLAFHEVCEQLLLPLSNLVDNRIEYECVVATHEIIITLENTVFKDSVMKERGM